MLITKHVILETYLIYKKNNTALTFLHLIDNLLQPFLKLSPVVAENEYQQCYQTE